MPAIRAVLAIAFLLLVLALPAVRPGVANIGYFVVMAVGCVLLALTRRPSPVRLDMPVALPLAGGALLVIAYTLTAETWTDPLLALYFAPLYLVAPGLAVLRERSGIASAEAIGAAALIGVLASTLFAVVDYQLNPGQQIGWSVNNPIHFAAVAVCLGFISLAGVHGRHPLLRIASLLGPVLGIAIAWFADTQGPLLGAVCMAVISVLILAYQFLSRRLALIALVASVLGAVAAGATAWTLGAGQNLPAIGELMHFLQTGTTLGPSANERLQMYESGIRAWIAAPWLGHGAANLTDTAALFAPEGVVLNRHDHLHNDVIDFAVSAGVPGLISYGLFILAMPLAAFAGPPSRSRNAAIIVALPMAAGYVVMGLSNAMFGVLTQTMLFGATIAIVAHLATRSEGSQ